MSGHSKGSTLKHKKAALDAKRGKAWSKLSRAVTMAAKGGGGNINDNPLFAVGAGPDEAPLATGSPAIDAGDDLALPADWADLDANGDDAEPLPNDITGQPRLINCVEMGAYEFQTTIFDPGDLDGSGTIDLGDYEGFAACLTGPCTSLDASECVPALFADSCCSLVDFENGGDVDLRDYATFQIIFGQ